jgi:hypothetical protein
MTILVAQSNKAGMPSQHLNAVFEDSSQEFI